MRDGNKGAIGRVAQWAVFAVWLLLPGAVFADRYALLVGINHYPRLRDRDLNGALNDVERMSQVLLREFAYPQANVVVLTDEKATLDGIRGAFGELARRVRPGDAVVFHYSGHGTLLPDDNGDEPDGQDEALCPYDFSDSGARALRDDELGRLLDALGPIQIAVVLDCCHSGTATKSANPRLRSRFVPAVQQAKGLFAAAKSLTTAPIGREILSAPGQQRVVLSACTEAQESVEIDVRFEPYLAEPLATGLMTYFLVEGLRGPADTNDDAIVSYNEAFAYARRQIDAQFNADQVDETERQTPVLEVAQDPLGDAPVFGVRQKRPLYARVEEIRADRAILDLGAVHGLEPEQVLGVYASPPAGTRLDAPLGQLKIAGLDVKRAEAKSISGLPPQRGVVVVPLVDPVDTSDLVLRVEPAPSLEPAGRAAAQAVCDEVLRLAAAIQGVRLAGGDAFDLRITVASGRVAGGLVEIRVTAKELNGVEHGPRQWQVAATGLSIRTGQVPHEIAAWIAELSGRRQTRMSLATLTNPAPGFGLQAVVDRRPAPGSNLPEYRVGDSLKFGLKASANCWYYIVAVDPADNAVLWCPQPGQQHYAPAGRGLLHPGPGEMFRVPGPPGVYVVKLLALRRPLGQEALADGIPRPDAFTSMPPSDWAESSVTFRVNE